ncbi:glycosyltransferase family 4 protein [Cellulosimicrobium sp. RS]|uniref:glycosyltransferase family 4 protein n=1 Tax=Cellulosimicrobium sp. RS TaxID=3381347 RepID=UPI0038FC00FA
MSTVLRGRATNDKATTFDFLFHNEAGGRASLAATPNIVLHRVAKGRINALAEYLASTQPYREISITSMPELANQVAGVRPDIVSYEVHSSDESVVTRELARLDSDRITTIQVPSRFSAQMVAAIAPNFASRVSVRPNLLPAVEPLAVGRTPHLNFEGRKPLLWVGRLDKGKNPNDFLRALALLPEDYIGLTVLSLENAPERISRFMGYAASLGLTKRIRVMMDLSPVRLARLYAEVARADGCFVSTSLMESFGYGVLEATSSGLRTVSYDVGALSEHGPSAAPQKLVDVGDVRGLVQAISELDLPSGQNRGV